MFKKSFSIIISVLVLQFVLSPLSNLAYGSTLDEGKILYQDETSVIYSTEDPNKIKVVEEDVVEYVIKKGNTVEILDENNDVLASFSTQSENISSPSQSGITPLSLYFDYRGCRTGSTYMDNLGNTSIAAALGVLVSGPVGKAIALVGIIKAYIDAGQQNFYYRLCATQYVPSHTTPYCLTTLTMFSDSNMTDNLGYTSNQNYSMSCTSLGFP